MKLFHISDLHLGLRLQNRDLAGDQKYILRQIADLAERERPDAVLIAGDIYDKAVPSAEAVELFNLFIDWLTEAVPEAELMLISGNHDSGMRLNCFRRVLERQKIHMIGLPPQTEQEYIEKVTLQDAYGPVHFFLLPFVKPSMVRQVVGTDENGNSLSYEATLRRLIARENIDTSARNVLVSHQFYLPAGKEADDVERMESEMRTVGNIDAVPADVLAPFDYAALGHIHKPMKVGSEVLRYCGTPLACSVSEAGQQKGVIMVELGEKDAAGRKTGVSEAVKDKAENHNGGDDGRNVTAQAGENSCVRTTVLPLTPLRQVLKISGTLEEILAQRCEDYVSVTLQETAVRTESEEKETSGKKPDEKETTGKKPDEKETTGKKPAEKELAVDVQDRIRSAFPYLLEIRREVVRTADYTAEVTPEKQKDPFVLCCEFLKNPDDAEKELLRDVIHSCCRT